jgi:hypothetical protein
LLDDFYQTLDIFKINVYFVKYLVIGLRQNNRKLAQPQTGPVLEDNIMLCIAEVLVVDVMSPNNENSGCRMIERDIFRVAAFSVWLHRSAGR